MAENDNVTIQTASSVSVRNRNFDGTIPITCRICRKFICNVDGRNTFYTATCIICSEAEKGNVVSKEIEDQLRLVRLPGGRDVPLAAVQPEPIPDPMVGDEAVVGKIQYWMRAIVATAEKVVKKSKSKELAKEKKHKPILAGGFTININKDEEK